VRPFTAKLPDTLIDAGGGVELRALVREDEDVLDALLTEPDVQEWFEADGGELVALIDEASVSPFLIRLNGLAIGYAQVYHANADAFWRDLGMPSETMGFDLSLGGAANRGQGIGPKVIRALMARVFYMQGVVQVIIDPHPENARAILAYSKCGFLFAPPQPGYYGEPMVLGVVRREDWGPA
jgi:aminoglycoside 6'-N-acetyltransferase